MARARYRLLITVRLIFDRRDGWVGGWQSRLYLVILFRDTVLPLPSPTRTWPTSVETFQVDRRRFNGVCDTHGMLARLPAVVQGPEC